jgi:hypothetical protein
LIWTNQADALLIRLWDEGGSLGYVARGMCEEGYAVTRNAVAGRKHRLKLDDFRRKTLPIKTVKPAKPINRPRRRIRMSAAPKTMIEVLEEMSRWPGVDYLDLPNDGCKAILNQPRGGQWMLQKVCGKKRTRDVNGNRSSYCAAHLRMYCNPATERKSHHGQSSQVPTTS